VKSLTLRDDKAASSVVLMPERGAIVTSFQVAGREFFYMDELTLLDASKNVRGGNPVLFPSPGKLQDDRWARFNKSGAMKQHGFARMLPWQVLQQDQQSVLLQLQSSEQTLAQYPWQFTASMQLRLQGNALSINTTLRNDDVTDMPFALGFHPYFAVADKSKLRIPTAASRCFNNVSKQTESFTGFDFTQAEVDIHLQDHRGAGVLDLGDVHIVIRASDEFGLWVVWSLKDKPFVCLEPWTAPGNALNTGDKLIVIPPHTSKTLLVTIAVDAK
jgi:galactose mutarotase-like enzyme